MIYTPLPIFMTPHGVIHRARCKPLLNKSTVVVHDYIPNSEALSEKAHRFNVEDKKVVFHGFNPRSGCFCGMALSVPFSRISSTT